MADIFTRGVAERGVTDKTGEVAFVLSTAGVKRDGLNLAPERWRLDRFNANPVLLVNHDYSELPIGTARVYVEDSKIKFVPTYDIGDPRAMEVKRKVDAGILNASSAGWGFVNADGTPFAGRNLEDAYYDLLDVSIVSVPADDSALAERARAARALLEQAEQIIAGDADGGDMPLDVADSDDVERSVETPDAQPARSAEPDTWERVAAAMVAVFTVDGDDADDKARRRRYNALLPKYRRLDKFPPEFLTADELRAIGPDEWRGLWLEGEVTERAGAVLNARNRERLAAARDAIDEVLASAETATASASADGSRAMTAAEAAVLAQGMASLAESMAALAGGLVADAPAETAAGAGDDAESAVPAGEPGADDEAAILAELNAALGD